MDALFITKTTGKTPGSVNQSLRSYLKPSSLAINSGSNIVFENNYCSGGHGISIGSISSDKTVSMYALFLPLFLWFA